MIDERSFSKRKQPTEIDVEDNYKTLQDLTPDELLKLSITDDCFKTVGQMIVDRKMNRSERLVDKDPNNIDQHEPGAKLENGMMIKERSVLFSPDIPIDLDVVCINGSNKTGKDFFIRLFKACVARRELSVLIHNVSSIDPYRYAFQNLFSGERYRGSDEQREALNSLKKLAVSYNDAPFEYIKERISDQWIKAVSRKKLDRLIVFVHVREPDEIAKIGEWYGNDIVTTVLIEADGPLADRLHIADNDADKNVSEYDYDLCVGNIGDIKQLTNQSDRLITYLLNKKS